MHKKITIKKAHGERVHFSEDKYRRSLRRSGASDNQINNILEKITPELHEGMSTHELYKKTHALMRDEKMLSSNGRYYLRQAIQDLGPTGFPFERYIAKLMEAQGFTTVVDQNMTGKCIRHEIDIIATKGSERLLTECKFHHETGIYCGIQTTLYVKARYDDVREGEQQDKNYNQCYLITNTKFSTDSIDYARCIGMRLLGWAYPYNNGLETIIDELGLHPITCLSSIPKKIVHALVNHGIVLCQDVIRNDAPLRQLGLSKNVISDIVHESQAICRQETLV